MRMRERYPNGERVIIQKELSSAQRNEWEGGISERRETDGIRL
jgi:hypothetical protein